GLHAGDARAGAVIDAKLEHGSGCGDADGSEEIGERACARCDGKGISPRHAKVIADIDARTRSGRYVRFERDLEESVIVEVVEAAERMGAPAGVDGDAVITCTLRVQVIVRAVAAEC